MVAGTFNALRSDNAFGIGRQTGNSDFQTGQAIGDGIAFVQGGVQTIAGAAGDVGGTLLDLTGIGAAIGVPAQVLSTAAAVDGRGVAGTAAKNLIVQASGTNIGQFYESTPQNQERMSKGKAPIGKDGKPVELHHEGQTSEGNLKEMTQTEHTGAERTSSKTIPTRAKNRARSTDRNLDSEGNSTGRIKLTNPISSKVGTSMESKNVSTGDFVIEAAGPPVCLGFSRTTARRDIYICTSRAAERFSAIFTFTIGLQICRFKSRMFGLSGQRTFPKLVC